MTPKKRKLVILIATHKPSVLLQDPMYQPIHCGRAVSHLNSKDLEWMKHHTIGDNTGDNISHLNQYFCELTAIYWAWKNYSQLGSPERIGLCHYRRYFMDIGLDNEITAPIHYLNKTISQQFCQHHASKELNKAISLLPSQEIRKDAEEYLSQNKGYFFNMFVFPRNLFFEYCNILFYLLFQLFKDSSWDSLDPYQRRMPGFLAERLTGAFIYHVNKRKRIPIHETLAIIPLFNSLTATKCQITITTNLVRYVPGFVRFYSNFLSAQTHFFKK